MANEKVIVEIDLELNQASVKDSFNEVDNTAKKAGSKTGDSFGRGFAQSFAGNVAAVAFNSVLQGIQNQIRGTVDAAKRLEVFETQFKTILGSSKAAQKQLKDLQNFAATTPFQIDGLALATRQLLSFGVAQEDVIGTLGQLGDISAGVGASIDELTIPYGRLISTQKLTLVELDKFADRGVNIYKELADQTGVSLAEIRDNISKGTVPFAEFTTALEKLTSEGGMFFGGAEAQSRTLAGTISTLEDNFFNLQGTLGEVFKDDLIEAVKETTGLIQSLTQNIVDNGPQIKSLFAETFDIFFKTPARFWINFFGGDAKGLQEVNKELERVNEQIRITENQISQIDANTGLKGAISDFFGGSTAERENLGELYEARAKLIQQQSLFNEVINPEASTGEGETNQDAGKKTAIQQQIEDFTNFQNVSSKFFEGFSADTLKGSNSIELFEKSLEDFGKAVKKNLVNGFAQATGQAFASFGAALANGDNALDAFVQSFLKSIGQMAVQQGTAFILQGIGYQFVPGLQGTGTALIGAGAALATFGGALSALTGGGAGSAATSQGSATTGSTFDQSATSFAEADTLEQREEGPRITVNVQGDVLDSQESSLRIVDLLNEAFDTQGATLRSTALA